jgi:hypothetical protein
MTGVFMSTLTLTLTLSLTLALAATGVGTAVLGAAAFGMVLPHAVEASPKVAAPTLTKPTATAEMRPTLRAGARLASFLSESLELAREPSNDTFGPFLFKRALGTPVPAGRSGWALALGPADSTFAHLRCLLCLPRQLPLNARGGM